MTVEIGLSDPRHPKECGFRLGLTAAVSGNAQIDARWEPEAKTIADLVYVAIRSDGAILKIGATGGTLHRRWRSILHLISAERGERLYRENEWVDRDRWREEICGRKFEVWFKPAEKHALHYLIGSERLASLRHTEEDYLDAYYCPLIGKKLDTRKRTC